MHEYTCALVHFQRLITQIKLPQTYQNISFVFVYCNKESLNRFPHAQKYPIQKRRLNSLYIFILCNIYFAVFNYFKNFHVISMCKQKFNSIPMF